MFFGYFIANWLLYNFVAASFHRTKLFSRLYSMPPFGRLSGNFCTPSIARWKARGRLYLRHNWTFFAISYCWDFMSGNRSKSAFFEGGGSLSANISLERGRRPPTTVGVRKLEWLPFVRYQNVRSSSFSFVTIHASDRQADGQTDRIATAISCIALHAAR